MNNTDFLVLMPLMIVAGVPVILMVLVAFKRIFPLIYGVSVAGFLLAFLSLIFVKNYVPYFVTTMLVYDGLSLFVSAIILLSAIIITLLSHRYLLYQESEKEEYFIILFVAVLGALLLVAAASFVTLFLGLETLSLSLFILIAYRRSRQHSMEAGVKYLILASVSSAFLLFGMGLLYTQNGSLDFVSVSGVFTRGSYPDYLFLTGFGMMMVGIGFKLALVPFHMWTPDIYQGAPVPVANFVATISKGAVLTLVLRFFFMIKGFQNTNFVLVLTVIAVLSMFAGNLLAIRQNNVKRILAYSSIANMGYLLVTLMVSNKSGAQSAVFYILSYSLTVLGAFGVITLLSEKENDAERITDYQGLFWKRPGMAMVFTICLLSLAGIPLTAGFMAKFYLVFAGINARLWLLVISLILSSIIGLYYYLRIITMMFSTGQEKEFPKITFTGNMILVFVTAGVIYLGLFPQWVLGMIQHFVIL